MKRYLILLMALLALQPALAIDDAEELDDPALQARYEQLIKELRCLQCQNQSIADSNAWLATDLRRQVRDMLLAGNSNQEIYDYMTSRYGDFVLYRSPLNRKTLLLWISPAVLLLLGIAVVVRVVIRRSHLPVDLDEPESSS